MPTHALRWTAATVVVLLGALPLPAQAANMPPPMPSQGPGGIGGGPMEAHRPPMERTFRMGPPGRWWDDPQMAQKLQLTDAQKKKMDDIFLQNRLKLIDQHAEVEKEETILEPMLSSDQPDEGKILAQIDKIAQSRAELEKANARMLLGLRRVLTTAQWQTLQTLDPGRGDRYSHHWHGGYGSRDDGPPPPDGAPAPGGKQN